MRDPNAVVYLIPGVGMITFRQATRPRRAFPASSTSTPSTSCAAPPTVSTYVGLPEQEAFDIEYWLLEEDLKLQRHAEAEDRWPAASRWSPAAPAASASATANAPDCGEGACVVLADIDEDRAEVRRTG
jgi:hypothetical protein